MIAAAPPVPGTCQRYQRVNPNNVTEWAVVFQRFQRQCSCPLTPRVDTVGKDFSCLLPVNLGIAEHSKRCMSLLVDAVMRGFVGGRP